jgi:hypothetical protein
MVRRPDYTESLRSCRHPGAIVVTCVAAACHLLHEASTAFPNMQLVFTGEGPGGGEGGKVG